MEEKKKKFRFQYHQAVSSHTNTELLPTWIYIHEKFFFYLIQLLYLGISLLQKTNLYPTSYILCLMNPQNPNIRLKFHISE